MIKIISIFIILLNISSCSMFCGKPDVIYEDKLVNVYPVLLKPIDVIDSERSIYNPMSPYITFGTNANGDVTFNLEPIVYGYKTFKLDGVVKDAVLVDSMQFAEMKLAFKILMSNHIYTKKFLEAYKKQYDKIENLR